ncbi:hypothetical protein HCUR_00128 [Holospora curviuscula]|uniref:Uncharacterized protein n=1 Tax=Holospora curviuscula TaxID=1082868 RepID=A0A2S5RI04_9PROT|nr:hypothetical protein HCUR_00128 [Holospora curviuscula]
MDKGYHTLHCILCWQQQSRHSHDLYKKPREFEAGFYTERTLVERMFNTLKIDTPCSSTAYILSFETSVPKKKIKTHI